MWGGFAQTLLERCVEVGFLGGKGAGLERPEGHVDFRPAT
jgi:hypothetical protein